jgi:plastocyanin
LTRFALALAALALLVAGCGAEKEHTRTVTAPANGTVRVVGTEYRFNPGKIVVRGAGTLRVTLVNDGSLAHDFTLMKDGREIGGTPPFPPDQSKSVRLRLASGDYEYICTVGDHAELGMKGKLKVE